ncbi:ATP-binding protein [uncultured Acetobacteroides sp.]|uniref:sensor histidine kinase n=1 Tax=uncultured Acetobacteroides sp. TaxID=1760811 RepID=UPI0029F4A1C0|nr:ATP-binding protein [uncultured Acetobacteroides sp.]
MKLKFRFWTSSVILYLVLAAMLFYGYRNSHLMLLVAEAFALLLLLAIIYFYQIIIKPVNEIASGAELLKEQDFSSRLPRTGQPDMDRLIDLFNRMMAQLKEERLRVREQHYFLDLMVSASPLGVIILDFDNRISSLNPAASRLLKVEEATGMALDQINHPLALEMEQLQPNEQRIIRLNGIHAYKCTRSYFIDRGFQHPFILVEELTQELIKTEKKAYEKVIRLMSHEVNNTIGATNSMLNLLSSNLQQSQLSYANDFRNVIDIATERGKNLCQLMSNFSEVVKIPEPVRQPVSLKSLIGSIHLLLEAECCKREISLSIEIPDPSPVVFADMVQMEQVIINIVKNSIEAIDRKGAIAIKVSTNPTTLVVQDNGKGISPKDQSMLFTPFYSTKTNGQGIGLMFTREILLNHQFQLSLQTVKPGQTEFRVVFD